MGFQTVLYTRNKSVCTKKIHIYVETYPASHFIGVTENAFRITSTPSLWNGTTYELSSKLLTEGYIIGDYYYYGGIKDRRNNRGVLQI